MEPASPHGILWQKLRAPACSVGAFALWVALAPLCITLNTVNFTLIHHPLGSWKHLSARSQGEYLERDVGGLQIHS